MFRHLILVFSFLVLQIENCFAKNLLLEISVQRSGSAHDFEYNTTSVLVLGEKTIIPLNIEKLESEKLELEIKAQEPSAAPGKRLIEADMTLYSREGESRNALAQGRILTRIHESSSLGQRLKDNSELLFTLSPVEVQGP